MSHLPQHLIVEILYFISKHMQNYYSNNDDQHGCLIAQYVVTQAGELEVHELLIDDKIQRVLASQRIRTPVYNTYICGPCDGLYYVWCWCDNKRFMWNPALNEFKVLPPIIKNPNLPSHIISDGFEHYGFGYDPRTKDYKVIVTAGSRDTTKGFGYDNCLVYPLSVFVYSLRDDKWRYWGDMSKYFYLEQNKCYVFVNDSVYWLGLVEIYDSYNDCDVIIAFNLATETCQELKAPSYKKPAARRPALAVCHDSLALLLSYEENNSFVMWCFNEEEWSKKCIINFDHNISYVRPLGHWKDSKIMFEEDHKLAMYDVETQEKWCLKNSYARCGNISAYKESLVSVLDDPNEPKLKGLFVPTNWFMLHTDASFISNAEPSGLAGCIRRKDGDWQLGFMEKVYATNALMAEILSILKGIIVCHNNGLNRVMVYSDCQNAVNLINQVNPTHDMYYNVLMKCKEWKLKMQQVKIRFSGRCNNTVADAMAQYCINNMNEINVTKTFSFPPKCCKKFYLSDCHCIADF